MSSNSHAEGTNEGLPRHRTDIQVMRGIAVLAVLLFHAKESWFTAAISRLPSEVDILSAIPAGCSFEVHFYWGTAYLPSRTII